MKTVSVSDKTLKENNHSDTKWKIELWLFSVGRNQRGTQSKSKL